MTERKIKILVGKPGLDGHDRGAKIVALALRDAGMEVVYTGLHQSVEQIVNVAIQEAVDVIGLSVMSGAHVPISKRLLELMATEGIEDIPVVVGGVIPKQDHDFLYDAGVLGIYGPGTVIAEAAREILDILIEGYGD